MNRVQSALMIRYALHELVPKDGAAVFQHVCRHLATMRIASNIVPATGPVSAGGDQGRDFETFRTYLAGTDLAPTTFIGRATDKMLAFGCTLQQKALAAKFEEDVKKTLAGGHPVNGVYAMCEVNVPVGERHKIEQDLEGRYHVEIHILDGEWIAEQLADRETFWIAEQFLGLPAAFYPDSLQAEPATWYAELRDEWRARTGVSGTFAEFSAVRRGIRHATYDSEAQADLPFWTGWLERLIETAPTPITRRAVYEIAIASFRAGTGTLKGIEDRLRRYMDEAALSDDTAALEDGQVLLMLITAADQRGLIDLRDGEIAGWRDRLAARVDDVLARTKDASTRAQLLQTLAHTTLTPVPPYSGLEGPRIKKAFAMLEQVVVEAKQGPLFPIDHFAQLTAVAAPIVVDQTGYEAFIRQLDDLLAERMGRASVAERARDRAVALHDRDRLLAALREFHRVRIDWFAGDTIRGSLLAMAMIAEIYHELHLHFASKYYALALAHLALNVKDPDLLNMAPRGVLMAATSDYETGALVGYIGLCDLGLKLRYRFEGHHPGSTKDGGDAVYGLVVLKGYASQHDPDLDAKLTERLCALDILDEINELLARVGSQGSYATPAAFADHYAQQLHALAFSDTGVEREIIWRALGLTWRVRFANDYETTRAAERFCALAQIALADLAEDELALLPTEITISLKATTGATSAKALPSNQGRLWDIEVPAATAKGDVESVMLDTLMVVTTVLLEASLLPTAKAYAVIERAFRDGIASKLLPNVSYDAAYTLFVDEDLFDPVARSARTPLAPTVAPTPAEHPELAWLSGPGPTYTPESAREKLEQRYRRLPSVIRYTLPRLLANARVRAVIDGLRADQWLDWRILGALAMRALNWRARQGGPRDPGKHVQTLLRLVGRPEEPGDVVVPLDIFTRKDLETSDNFNLPSTLKTWDLELKQRTPDIGAIRRFLDERYRQDKDDVEHPDPFAFPVEAS